MSVLASNAIRPGAVVRVTRLRDNLEMSVTIHDHPEKIHGPLPEALLEHQKGDVVEVLVAGRKPEAFKIEEYRNKD